MLKLGWVTEPVGSLRACGFAQSGRLRVGFNNRFSVERVARLVSTLRSFVNDSVMPANVGNGREVLIQIPTLNVC